MSLHGHPGFGDEVLREPPLSELSIFIRPRASLRRGRRSGRGCRVRLSWLRGGFTYEAADFELKPRDFLRIMICHPSSALRLPNMSQLAVERGIEFEYKEKEKERKCQ